jgi:hypothetical protein
MSESPGSAGGFPGDAHGNNIDTHGIRESLTLCRYYALLLLSVYRNRKQAKRAMYLPRRKVMFLLLL